MPCCIKYSHRALSPCEEVWREEICPQSCEYRHSSPRASASVLAPTIQVLRTGFHLWVLVPLQAKGMLLQGMMLQCPVSSAEHLHSNIWVLSSCCTSNADCSGGTEGQEATAWAKHKSKCEHSPLLPLYSLFPPAGCAINKNSPKQAGFIPRLICQ